MSPRRSNREEKIYQSYLYPGSEVFKNKLDIRDPFILGQAETLYNMQRNMQLPPRAALELSYKGFLALHQHLFQDIYTWAGKQRDYTTGRGPAPFAPPEHIKNWMEDQFKKLKKENYLQGLSKELFAEKIGPIVNEINAAHPFIEGNGRTQRLWLQIVADQAGHKLSLKMEDRESWYEASRIGFEQVNHKPMIDLIKKCLDRENEQEKGRERKSLSSRLEEIKKEKNNYSISVPKKRDLER